MHTTTSQLEQAAAYNHTELFCRNALARGGEIRTMEDLTYTYEGPDYQSMIAFPSLSAAVADRRLDEMMDWYASRPTRGLGCWSLAPPQPADLGARLKARGFQDGWQPCWMALELGQMKVEYDHPAGLRIVADNDISLSDVKDLPYTGRHSAVSPELLHYHPEQAQQFVALLKGRIVGHSSMCITNGVHGVAGIYDVAVVPSARQKGIGKALVLAACLKAKEKGIHYAVLNATGRRMYEQIGFRWLGDGFTWWLLPPND
ncbi:MAG: GNAT family N-acetyltransferase [Chitinophagaceae bacterium]|nr:GNAT family N-acetyltransferase [Chitinophagaceae bacterium]